MDCTFGTLAGFRSFGKQSEAEPGSLKVLSDFFIYFQLNDLTIVEEASRYLQAINSTRKNDSATDDLEQKMSTLTLGREEACGRIAKIVGNFAHLVLLLENDPELRKGLVALQAMPKHLQDFSNTYGMVKGEDYSEAIIKLSRALRNIQYQLEKTAGNHKSSVTKDADDWDAALKEWLSNLVSCISGILSNESTVSRPEGVQRSLALTVRLHYLVRSTSEIPNRFGSHRNPSSN
jgi:hypothetical protein